MEDKDRADQNQPAQPAEGRPSPVADTYDAMGERPKPEQPVTAPR